jgi:chromosome segregation ATPase
MAGGTAGGSFGLVFVSVRWAANFFAGRLDKRQDHIDVATKELIDGLRRDVSDLRSRVASTEEQLRECQKQHADARKEVMELRGMMQGYGDANQNAQRIIALDAIERKEAKG